VALKKILQKQKITIGSNALPAQIRSLIPANPAQESYNARAAKTIIETVQEK
jgi:hypothetical protein